MSPIEYLKPEFSPDAFKGTAVYYSRYRIPYPQELFDDLIKRSATSRQGTLLDLASGPGRIAVRLAPMFSAVRANDIEPEMIAEGKSEAEKNSIDNIEWLTGRAEELQMEPDSIDLITIGEAFHRLDQDIITDLALRWLKPGGHIAVIGCYGILSGDELWQEIVREVVNKWTSHHSVNYEKPGMHIAGRGAEHCRLVLQDKGFVECSSYSFSFPYYCTIESIIGYLYSTSRCSKKVLCDNTAVFESELRTALNNIYKQSRFFENIRCGYTLGKKPHS
jgi:SAM-dependent methyltransferase